MNGSRNRTPARKLLTVALAGCLALGVAPAMAQSTGATIRGQVTADSTPAAGATIVVINPSTGLRRTVQAGADGRYSVAGLPPGTYRIEVQSNGQGTIRELTVQVGQTATLDLGVGGMPETATAGDATTLTAVQVVGTAVETRTSEVASYVTNKQIEILPQNTRNFLAFADTVPGMAFEQNPANGATRLRGGVQSANNINVYIDGVGQKNYVIKGGITGQDSSRGNPFPQMAIGEYKVITSNYKAEYDQISSAAVTAVTRSGTNEFGGSFFWDYTNQDWRTARVSEANGKTRSSDEQYGVSFSGPIVKDVAHFFVAYEAKEYNSPVDVTPGQGLLISSLPPDLQPLFGKTSVPFKEDLYFGKLDWSIGESHLVELTFKRRDETGISNVGGQSASTYGTNTHVAEDRYDLRWQFSNDNWLNDAHLTYEDAYWIMEPVNYGNGFVLTTGTSNDGQQIIRLGAGNGGLQNKGQDGWSLQDDLTFFGWESHTLKMGVKYKKVDLNTIEQQPYNPQFFYDINQGATQPYFVRFGSSAAGTAGGTVNSGNSQFGIYIQDDWEATEKLTVNLGLRWDYEQTPAFLDFVTDPAVVTAMNTQDPQSGAAVGQTYRQTLAKGGIEIDQFISNGNNRNAFSSAWQPRVGFSYDLFNDERHVIFGGVGRAYDRNLFDYLQLEQTKATFPTRELRINSPGHPCTPGAGNCIAWNSSLYDRDTLMALVSSTQQGREVWMFQNDLKVPYADQLSLGMRNAVDLWGHDWNTSATIQHIRYNDGLLMIRGNRRGDGAYFDGMGSPWTGGGVPGMGGLILGINGKQSRSTQLLLSVDKPYTSSSPWNFNLAYTYTSAEQNIHEKDPEYGWYWPLHTTYSGAWTPRHRVVLSGFSDLPWGLTASGKLTLASPVRHWVDVWPPASGTSSIEILSFEPNGSIGFKQFDMSVQRVWDTGSNWNFRLRADVINVFDWENWGGYGKNWATGNINSWDQYPTRTFKLSIGVNW